MKKVAKLFLYVALLTGTLLLIYRHAVYSYIVRLTSSQQGVLLQCFNSVSRYFKDADALNLIFLVVFCCIALLAFIGIDYAGKYLFLRLQSKGLFAQKVFTVGWLMTPIHKLTTLTIVGGGFILLCNLVVVLFGQHYSVNSADLVPSHQPVLILGTSKMLSSGKGINLYYKYRIDAAVDLWKSGKATYFIISGDRSSDAYDETRDISSDLLAAGVPADKIKVDTAGFRTLDSMLRIRVLFKTRELVIVTQAFHLQRAIILAHFFAIHATGLVAKGSSTWGMRYREFFSKPKVLLDLVFFNMQPRVKIPGQERIEFRDDFAVTSDLHVVLLIALSIAALSTLGVAFKYIN